MQILTFDAWKELTCHASRAKVHPKMLLMAMRAFGLWYSTGKKGKEIHIGDVS